MRENCFLLLCNPTQIQILIFFWMKTPSWPPHPGPWEITSNSCTNLSHLLQMSDGKAAVLHMPLLPPSWGSLRVLPLSCGDHSCLLPLQHLSMPDPEGPADLPSPPCPVLQISTKTTSSTAAPGANSARLRLAGEASLPNPSCTGAWTQLFKSSVQAQQLRLSTFPPSHLLTACLTLLPMCSTLLFNHLLHRIILVGTTMNPTLPGHH